jgi:hypothetical protein
MPGKTEVLLAPGIVLSSIAPAAPAWAAARHHHSVTRARTSVYDIDMMVPAAAGGGCPANGGPGCSTEGQSAPPDWW